ncbi:unnamed protein product [Peronospora belbahrii]|uniref:Rhodanese domain-containing protein n=1 Tax=Peronospora belbahrii TaxID=622444 RepID=A0AAU9KUB8_9STRA|nr:unnamed protein product [Peronospora belbahrii]
MLVKKFGVKAQLKLQIAKVLLIGVGGLGSPAAMYLAAMGVDTLAIVDDDHVDRMYPMPAANALKLVGEYDVVVDASDNVDTRYLVNDACARSQNGVLGAVPGVIGCLQAMETVKIICNVGEPLVEEKPGLSVLWKHVASSENHEMVPIEISPLVEGNCTNGGEIIDDLDPVFSISAEEFAKVRKAKQEERDSYLLLDTRGRIQFEMVHFPEAVNIPTDELMRQDPAHV